MLQPIYLTDDQLKELLLQEYILADESETIDALKAELYARGYRWVEIVELAIAALLRRFRAAKSPLAYPN